VMLCFATQNFVVPARKAGSRCTVCSIQSHCSPLAALDDDDTRLVGLPFAFPFFGVAYNQVYVNSDGNLTFTAGDFASTDRSLGRMTAGAPRISPLFDDLNPAQTAGGVHVFADSTRVVVSWVNVPEYAQDGTGPPQTFQVRLYPDGRIQFSYAAGISPSSAVVGIAPGNLQGSTTLVDFTLDPTGNYSAAVAERFGNTLAIDIVTVAQQFYQTHEDAYDYLVIYNNMDIPAMPGAVAYESTVRSSGAGYGFAAQDDGQEYGSASRLQSLMNMGPLSEYPTDPTQLVPLRASVGDTPITILAHEAGHLFLAFASVNDPNGASALNKAIDIRVEDLLERDEIKLDENAIRKELVDKCILVTGAAGSIGSELVRQISKFRPSKIILLDQAESPLYHMELELNEAFRHVKCEIVVGDINNKVRMRKLFEIFNPQIVFHAAAYKHVPMMENNPVEAVHTNVSGTKIISDLSIEFKVDKFVMISTDKAVNPTSVMGASKRIAEMYTQALNQKNVTRFITTRFGNVLGSNGSVIPLFRDQIEKGGPVTITDPEVTRYFMTIPEACRLVLEAVAIGKGSEIFIFDMGKSVKILDLAKKMIKLSRLTLGKDIQITYTGLRPGEKLYEELLNDKENTLPTHHSQIMIAKVNVSSYEIVSNQVDELIGLLCNHNNMELVKKMKELVPEFKSQNSVYEVLDKNKVD